MFQETVNYTFCPFAAKSFWLELCVDPGLSLADQVDEAVHKLRTELPAAHEAGKDLVSLKLTHPLLLQDIGVFTRFLSSLLHALSDDGRSMGDAALFEQHGWRYWTGDIRCFVLSFAPFYESSHPRYSNCEAAYIVFQFESSFERTGVSFMSTEELRRLSKVVKGAFERNGRDYFGHITHGMPEALHVVKPLYADSPPVRWWEERL